jgi:hypothetical protein
MFNKIHWSIYIIIKEIVSNYFCSINVVVVKISMKTILDLIIRLDYMAIKLKMQY